MSEAKEVEIQESDTSTPEGEGIQKVDTPIESAEDAPEVKDTEDATKEAETVTPNDEVAALNKRIQDKDRFIRQQHEELTSLKQAPQEPATKQPVDIALDGKPQLDSYEDYEQYNEALVDWKFNQRDAQQVVNNQAESEARAKQERIDGFEQRASTFRAKQADFDEVARSPEISHVYGQAPHLADIVESSEAGPEIAYYFGNNPDIAANIASMSPYQAAIEVGKLEAKVTTAPKPKNITQAPTPITPVGGGHDPAEKKVEDMTPEEYKVWRVGK
jgi:hypothetical protein